MTQTRRVLFVYFRLSTFVERDLQTLRKHHSVRPVQWKPGLAMGRSALDILRGVYWCDVTITWFAGIYGAVAVFASKMLRRKSIVVVGGYDVAKVPQLQYGAFSRSKEAIPARYCLANASRVLVTDESLRQDAMENARVTGENIEYLPTGYDAGLWKPGATKERLALTVAVASDRTRLRLKGLDTFVRAAKRLPDVHFVLVGVSGQARDQLESRSPKNVTVQGVLPERELLRLYQRAGVYCQLAYREGLPNSLCEAMLCECTPVGTQGVPGIKRAMGEVGYYVPYGDEEATAQAIRRALDTPERGARARARIAELFPPSRRERGLLDTIEGLVVG